MLPKIHVLIGLLFSASIYFVFPEINLIYLLIFFLSSFLIDFDHYLYYVYKYKNFGIIKAYKTLRQNSVFFKKLTKEERKKFTSGIFIFHGIESIIISFILGLFWEGFYFIGLGIFLHLVLDYIEKVKNPHPPYKISIIYDLLKFKKYKEVSIKRIVHSNKV